MKDTECFFHCLKPLALLPNIEMNAENITAIFTNVLTSVQRKAYISTASEEIG